MGTEEGRAAWKWEAGAADTDEGGDTATNEEGVLGTDAGGADERGDVEAGVDEGTVRDEADEGTFPGDAGFSVGSAGWCAVTAWGVGVVLGIGVKMRWRTNRPVITRKAPAKLQIQKKNFFRRCFSGMILCHMSAGTGEE